MIRGTTGDTTRRDRREPRAASHSHSHEAADEPSLAARALAVPARLSRRAWRCVARRGDALRCVQLPHFRRPHARTRHSQSPLTSPRIRSDQIKRWFGSEQSAGRPVGQSGLCYALEPKQRSGRDAMRCAHLRTV